VCVEMEAACSSETSVLTYHTARRHVPEALFLVVIAVRYSNLPIRLLSIFLAFVVTPRRATRLVHNGLFIKSLKLVGYE